MLIINFKTYETAVGDQAVALAQVCEKIAKECNVEIGVAVTALDLAAVAAAVSIPVFAQHVDAVGFGSATGSLPPRLVRQLGGAGTLLNHSERRIPEVLATNLAAAKDAGLTTIVCAESADEAARLAKLKPDFIAVEPPELIGGDISVTTANPEIIKNAVLGVVGVPLLVGAGVKNGIDVAAALKFGAVGVLLASGVTKSADPAAVLRDLASGLQK